MHGTLGAALALVVIGVLTLLVIPWVGIAAAAIGVILLVVYFVGAARRTRERRL